MSSVPLGSRLIAPGCRVRTAAGGERIEVEAHFPFSGWTPRQAAGRTIAGTPVLVGDRWYEVISAHADEGRWSYLLGPWPTDESIRAPSELTAQSADATLVELEHRYLERFGERGKEMAEKVGAPNGWPDLLNIYAASV